MTIRIFVTGGTFDKEYQESSGDLYFKDTHVSEILEKGRCRVPYKIRTLMLIDSLDMIDEDRETVYQNCKIVDEDRILITHGTDNMIETANYLASGISGKTIVLTGAMVPYAFGSSDGMFNLGAALGFVQTLPPGVYIAMNGICFNHDNVRKNKEKGLFEYLKQ